MSVDFPKSLSTDPKPMKDAFRGAKVLPIRQLPPSEVETVLANAQSYNLKSVLVVGQNAEGFWSFQFGGLASKVEAIGMLECMKQEVFVSMEEV
jgi:hypothetical protein